MADVKKKVAILGGGVGALTAAWHLTEKAKNDPATQYDITVYQMGWRLGGKCASGRNMKDGYGHRIEEHGIHVWMGFYANAFRMIKKVYEEMDRPKGKSLRTWDEAFKPLDYVTNMSASLFGWQPWTYHAPCNYGKPGDEPQFRAPCAFLELIPPKLRPLIDSILKKLSELVDPQEPPDIQIDILAVTAQVDALGERLDELIAASITREAKPGHKHLDLGKIAREAHRILGRILKLLRLAGGVNKIANEIIKWVTLIDIGLAMFRGILKNRLCEKNWGAIEHYNWKEWLLENGLQKENEWCPPVKVVYELLFAFRDGIPDKDHADLSATWGTLGVLRMVFEYQGSMFWKMQAGMGDVVFGPLYEVLEKRGVKFKFFHRVTEVVPAPDGESIASVQIDVQATVKEGDYKPTFEVENLPGCWPATPFYDQLVGGEYLEKLNIDLEQYDAPWPPAKKLTLEAGVDFDWVIFGLSLGAVPKVCQKIVDQKPAWKHMLDKVGTVHTQAFQLWLNEDTWDLGWGAPPKDDKPEGNKPKKPLCPTDKRALLGGFVEPLDTWGDWSQVIPYEDWPGDPVKSIAYFCGPALAPPEEETNVAAYGLEYVAKNALELMSFDYHWIWPKAYDDAGEFRWDYLVDPNDKPNDEVKGVARFGSQFFRYNFEPTELYVQSFAGTTGARIGQGQNTVGYSNLCVVGDWTNSPFPVGCVEGAVIGAMDGIEPITGALDIAK